MNKFIKCDLQLFADGSDGGMNAGVAEGSNAVTTAQDNQFATDNGTNATDSSQTDANDKAANFKAMITGEYKDEYQNVFEKQLSKRMKASNKTIADHEEFRGKVAPLLDRLAVKYGVTDPNNVEAIMAAAENDNSFFEEYALQHGVDVETAKQLIKAERITAENERRQADEIAQAEFQQKYKGWLQQAALVQQKYPAFDFEYESTNDETGEQFRRLLNSGVDVETAYTVIHRNEIMGGAIQFGYKSAKQEMADARTARSARPAENGTSSQQASAVYDDMTKLSKSDREKIKAAVFRGERVTPENFRDYL